MIVWKYGADESDVYVECVDGRSDMSVYGNDDCTVTSSLRNSVGRCSYYTDEAASL